MAEVKPMGNEGGVALRRPRTGVGRVFGSFARDTNIEGINNAGRSLGSLRRVVWLAVVVFLVALTVSDLVGLTQEYLTYPVDVATTIDHKVTVE